MSYVACVDENCLISEGSEMGSSILSRKRPRSRSRSRRKPIQSTMGKVAWGLLLLVLGLHLLLNSTSSQFFVVGTVLVAVAIPILLVAVTTKPLCLPPGPKGVPFLGYLPLILTELPHQHLAELTKEFGPLVHLQLGSTPAVLVTSPAVMEVLMPQDQVFAARPPALLSSKYFAYTPNHEPLGPVRRLYTMEMLSAKRFEHQNFKASRAAEMQTMVRTLWADSAGGSKSLDLRSTTFLPMANNIVAYMLSRHRWGDEVQSLVSDVVRGCVSVSLASFFLTLRPLTAWMSGEERRMVAAGKRMDAYLQSLLDASRKHPTTSDAEKTLVDMVLEFERDDGAALDDRTRKCVLLELILAATETVAMVEWTMAELVRNPEVMHKVQSELDDVVGTLRFVEEEDLPKLPYLATLFQETSRLHPPSPLLFPHQITRQTQINGYDIPVHSRIILNTWAIGRDSKMWDNPEDYNPERFMENINKKGDYKGQSLNFLPFGASGSNIPLEYNVVMLALGYLCQSFEWTLPKGMDPKMISIEEHFGLACTMKHPLQSHYIKPRLELHLYAPP